MSSMILSCGGGAVGGDQSGTTTKLKSSNSIGQNMDNLSQSGQSVSPTKQLDISAVIKSQQVSHSRQSSGNQSQLTTITQASSPNQQTLATNSIGLVNTSERELIFPFEIGRVALCRACGCCFHLQCFLDADHKCPKCERIQRRKAETEESEIESAELGPNNGKNSALEPQNDA